MAFPFADSGSRLDLAAAGAQRRILPRCAEDVPQTRPLQKLIHCEKCSFVQRSSQDAQILKYSPSTSVAASCTVMHSLSLASFCFCVASISIVRRRFGKMVLVQSCHTLRSKCTLICPHVHSSLAACSDKQVRCPLSPEDPAVLKKLNALSVLQA